MTARQNVYFRFKHSHLNERTLFPAVSMGAKVIRISLPETFPYMAATKECV